MDVFRYEHPQLCFPHHLAFYSRWLAKTFGASSEQAVLDQHHTEHHIHTKTADRLVTRYDLLLITY